MAPPLTIGYEIECILVSRNKEPIDGVKIIQDVLSNSRKQPEAECATRRKPHNFSLELWREGDDGDPYAKWSVVRDPTAEPTKEEKEILGKHLPDYQFNDIEIRSRVLHLNKTLKTWTEANFQNTGEDHTHEVSYDEEIKAVLNLLRTELRDFREHESKKYFYLYVNPNCGLHVHIGRGKTGHDSLELPVVKKIFAAMVACEKQIDGLHAVSRITGSKLGTTENPPKGFIPITKPYEYLIDKTVGNLPPSVIFVHTTHGRRCGKMKDESSRFEPEFRCDIGAWITLIRETKTLKELDDLQRKQGRTCTINLYRVTDPKGRSRPTIEFRQHTGTLEPTEVLAYIDFLTKLVSGCHTISDNHFYAKFQPLEQISEQTLTVVSNADFSRRDLKTLSLCRDIGCSKETIKYYELKVHEEGDKMPRKQALREIRDAAAVRTTRDNFDPMALLIECNAEIVFKDTRPSEVNAWIQEKLKEGGYGQFSAAYLKSVCPPEATAQTRAELELGYNIKPHTTPKELLREGPSSRTVEGMREIAPGYEREIVPAESLAASTPPSFSRPSMPPSGSGAQQRVGQQNTTPLQSTQSSPAGPKRQPITSSQPSALREELVALRPAAKRQGVDRHKQPKAQHTAQPSKRNPQSDRSGPSKLHSSSRKAGKNGE